MNDHIGKELAAREIAKALSKLSIDELRKVALKYDVDITYALEGEFFTKTMLADEDESLIALAKRSGNPAMIDAAKRLDALMKRADEQDAAFAKMATYGDELKTKKRGAEDERIMKEYRETGVRPLAMWQREGAERHAYLNGRDDD